LNSSPKNRAEVRALCDNIRRRALSPVAGRRTKLKKVGSSEHLGLCPFHTEKTPSFRVYDREPSHYYCYGCEARGDAIDLYQQLDNLDFFAALEAAAAAVGLIADLKGVRAQEYKHAEPALTPDEEIAHEEAEEKKCRDMWQQALPAMGSLVERYLREHRKISIEHLPGGVIPPTLRFEPACAYWHPGASGKMKLIGKFPAMIAPLQDCVTDIQVGAHITYLDPRTANKLALEVDGEKIPAKKMRGTSWGCAIRLAAAAEFMTASEGIENGLCGMMCGAPPAWAAGSLNNLAGRGIGTGLPHPRRLDKKLPSVYPDMRPPYFGFPAMTKRVLLLREKDGKDQEQADKLFERALRRFSVLKQEAYDFTPDDGDDLNDMVIAGRLAPGGFNAAST
jgi:hypothetical protein